VFEHGQSVVGAPAAPRAVSETASTSAATLNNAVVAMPGCQQTASPADKPNLAAPPKRLQDIAIARSGDKGNRATLSVIARDPAYFPVLERLLTAERVKAHYQGVVHGEVQHFSLPHLGAVHFVMHDALGGGVTRSLALDAHGKTLSAAILDAPLP
jgi:hypothetical protein